MQWREREISGLSGGMGDEEEEEGDRGSAGKRHVIESVLGIEEVQLCQHIKLQPVHETQAGSNFRVGSTLSTCLPEGDSVTLSLLTIVGRPY